MGNFILAIESASRICSVALYEDEQLVDHLEEGGSYSHAEKLAPFIDELLKKHQLNTKSLSAVAVSSGPGSYTGLRIGLSLAKGICFASEIPLMSVPTLQGIFRGASEEIKDEDALYFPMIDARRMEVYCVLYDYHGLELEPLTAVIIDEHSFQEYLKDRKIYFVGDGAQKCKDIITSNQAIFPEDNFISAAKWGKLIHEKFSSKDFVDLAYFEPGYFKKYRAKKAENRL